MQNILEYTLFIKKPVLKGIICLYFSFMLISQACFAQNSRSDSILVLVQNAKQDTLLVENLVELAITYENSEKTDYAIHLLDSSLNLAIRLKYFNGEARCYNTLGIFYTNLSNYTFARDNFYKALNLYRKLGNKQAISSCLGNLGVVFRSQDLYAKALEFYLEDLKICEELKDQKGICRSLSNIGNVYLVTGAYNEANTFYLRAIKLANKLDDKIMIATLYNALGNVHTEQKSYREGLSYYFKALELNRKTDNYRGISVNLSNIGLIYDDQRNYEKALECYDEAIKIKQRLKDKLGTANLLNNIGSLYKAQKNYPQAEANFLEAIVIAGQVGSIYHSVEPNNNLSELYLAQKNYKKAYEYLKVYQKLNDSIFSIEKSEDLTRKEMNYEFEKKEALTKAEHEKELAIADAEKKRQRLFSCFVGALAAAIGLIALIIFRSLSVTKKQKQTIEKQKLLVEEHQKEIIDSITYAKRLQEAILPSLQSISEKLPNSFVFYKPKDIVAGDFYWMEEQDGIVFIAAADCTGHGVPGALVSVVCSNALNRAVKEFEMRETGKILDKVRELVVETFEKSSNEVKDGMDISLMSINRKNKTITWSGANNPLWYIDSAVPSSTVVKETENSSEKPTLIEIKADKQAIGKTENPLPFTTRKIAYSENTSFYLFTDGLADQFGGSAGKKFKYKQFSDFLISIHTLSFTEQALKIEERFNNWKGHLDQVDDVCVIGITL